MRDRGDPSGNANFLKRGCASDRAPPAYDRPRAAGGGFCLDGVDDKDGKAF
jgi:hypothetical protein